MAAPNLINPSGIVGKTQVISPTGVNETTLLTNAASSNKVLKTSSLIVANAHGSSNIDCTINFYDSATSGTAFPIISTVSIPADSTVVVLGKDSPLWIEEDRRLTVVAGSGNAVLDVFCSYEEIS